MSIKIIKPGLFTTVQDLGRFGHQEEGFSPTGVMDRPSFEIANALLNTTNQPTLEITLVGPTIQFLKQNLFAVTGAPFDMKLNGNPIPHQTVIKADQGDILEMGTAKNGMRAYIGFVNTLNIPLIEGSAATHTRTSIGGYKGRLLKAKDILPTHNYNLDYGLIGRSTDYQSFSPRSHVPIGIMDGPQLHAFSKRTIKEIENIEFKVSDSSDRMGYRLRGTSIKPSDSADIISEPVALGSIQVPNDGNPIILLNDRQTVGGYTKIATVIDCDIVDVIQKRPGEIIQFEWVTFNEANKILDRKNRKLQQAIVQIQNQPKRYLNHIRPSQSKIKSVLKGDCKPWI